MVSFNLPPELWLEIFAWATSSRTHSYSTNYEPFEPLSGLDGINNVGKNLVLVCRQWHALATELLYKNLIIGENAHALCSALQRGGHGKLVRRVVLPYTSTVTTAPPPLPSVRSLELCSQLEILVRPPFIPSAYEGLRIEFDAGACHALPSLRRLEWWHNNEAARSGGINLLEDVLFSAPNLQYLLVGGIPGFWFTAPRQPICLKELQTLRLRLGNGLFLRHISKWTLPTLTNVIVDTPMRQALGLIWEKFGPQLETVEFGQHLGFTVEDSMTLCLESCPNLVEINYHVIFATKPDNAWRHRTIQRVGLHLNPSFHLIVEEVWEIIDGHFRSFTEEAFPNLKEIRLYGQWAETMFGTRFDQLRKAMARRGCAINTTTVDTVFQPLVVF
ncbi:hypothetical protein HGRIS_008374 [Hohenbuehelia grisea]|uniref:F-box domain-containing protein n=1 Tax=Hohenbuehelia grisea TaxID=104357 RepID=A0ABR3J899_9AGAR